MQTTKKLTLSVLKEKSETLETSQIIGGVAPEASSFCHTSADQETKAWLKKWAEKQNW